MTFPTSRMRTSSSSIISTSTPGSGSSSASISSPLSSAISRRSASLASASASAACDAFHSASVTFPSKSFTTASATFVISSGLDSCTHVSYSKMRRSSSTRATLSAFCAESWLRCTSSTSASFPFLRSSRTCAAFSLRSVSASASLRRSSSVTLRSHSPRMVLMLATDAQIMHVSPALLAKRGSAPASRSGRTHSSLPMKHARHSGVRPCSPTVFGSAPRSRSSLTVEPLPPAAASESSVLPCASAASTSAPSVPSSRTRSSSSPSKAASSISLRSFASRAFCSRFSRSSLARFAACFRSYATSCRYAAWRSSSSSLSRASFFAAASRFDRTSSRTWLPRTRA
mmetsp:Transcript_19841/g.64541  ORF Transcript_19841/g.64541 Transcript_19841/m.64541 type:complete len:343 (+) Transcript_19841:526-1554(+)